MGRLIDEGELVKVLEERATNEAICGYITAYDVTNSIIDEVKEQPTAYDPDQVVEQLNDCSMWKELLVYEMTHREREIVKRAIEIVKGGGVNE